MHSIVNELFMELRSCGAVVQGEVNRAHQVTLQRGQLQHGETPTWRNLQKWQKTVCGNSRVEVLAYLASLTYVVKQRPILPHVMSDCRFGVAQRFSKKKNYKSFLETTVSTPTMSGLLRSRPLQLIVTALTLGLFVYYFFFSGDSEKAYTPEQINDMFQNKDKAVPVKKTELSAVGILAPYIDKSLMQTPNWHWSGDIIAHGNDFLRLTSGQKHQVGNMFSKMPMQADSFELELSFHIHSPPNELPADGMAIWILDEPSPIGDVFGARNNFNGLGLFIDTYRHGKKKNFPYVSAMLGDGHTKYNKWTDGEDTQIAGCSVKALMNPLSKISRMRLVYTRNGYLSVDFNHNVHSSDDWHNCFTLSDVQLPPVKYLGISAETGDLAQYVDIIENKVYALFDPVSGDFIDSVELLEHIIEDQEKPDKQSRANRRSRKSAIRLKKAEQRIKALDRQRRLQKYGDENATFVRRTISRILFAVKLVIFVILAGVLVWALTIVYRMKKNKRKARKGGILD